MGDEIDEILLLSLKDIGISLESLRDIDAATLVNAAVTPPSPPSRPTSAHPPRPARAPNARGRCLEEGWKQTVRVRALRARA